MGGLRWHAMHVGRLLRSTEGVGAESHRVAKVAQGCRFEESQVQGVAESQRIEQASRLGGGGVALAGPARFTRADTMCDETMVAWQASRRQAWLTWRRQAWRR